MASLKYVVRNLCVPVSVPQFLQQRLLSNPVCSQRNCIAVSRLSPLAWQSAIRLWQKLFQEFQLILLVFQLSLLVFSAELVDSPTGYLSPLADASAL